MQDLQIDNLPNRLTIFRMLLIPLVVLSLYFCQDTQWFGTEYIRVFNHLAGWTFVVASITDFFDGYIARKRNIVTVFGSFLDPVADKFLVVSSLIMLQAVGRVHPIVVIILVLREMYMTSLRLLAMNEGLSIPVSQSGKWKTTFQMIAIPMLMINETLLFLPLPILGNVSMLIAVILSMWSAIVYSWGLIKTLKAKRSLNKNEKRANRRKK